MLAVCDYNNVHRSNSAKLAPIGVGGNWVVYEARSEGMRVVGDLEMENDVKYFATRPIFGPVLLTGIYKILLSILKLQIALRIGERFVY
jgi:hypothetical protein